MTSRLYRRSPDAIFSEVGNDVVALHLDRGQCYGMENVTAKVWSLLAEATTIEAICDQLMELYEVDSNLCRTDVERLIQQFVSEGLVETVAQSRHPGPGSD